MCVNKVAFDREEARIRTRDLLIASPHTQAHTQTLATSCLICQFFNDQHGLRPVPPNGLQSWLWNCWRQILHSMSIFMPKQHSNNTDSLSLLTAFSRWTWVIRFHWS